MNKFRPSNEQIDTVINLALAEDISQGDITSEALIPAKLQGKAIVLAKDEGILAGGEVARQVFLKVSSSLKVELLMEDGTLIHPGDVISTISGRVIDILKAERVALNFLQRLSGIASLTARYVAETAGLGVSICDTRKTTPGLRILEKYAVSAGGGKNHRFHLGDGILIKDNHLTALRTQGMSLKDIVAQARRNVPAGLAVEVEVSTAVEAMEAVQGGADAILLDNMSPDEIRRAVTLIPGHVKTEASGGITLTNVRAIAMCGVNTISIGALTHSVKALDISLELEPGTIKPVPTK
ncbi:MAG: carboxylating nicotinate-nucleotide diphosphorylase [Dehalococcoidales bacterium]|nr:carboxylating nicotinate-nucleotide diphosphorylase [Dehalococcoidales bacterium]